MLRIATATLQRAFPDFRFVEPIRSWNVSGLDAAYMKAMYTIKTSDGRSVPVLARTWLVPRGTYMIVIGMSGATEGSDICEREFAEVASSISIER